MSGAGFKRGHPGGNQRNSGVSPALHAPTREMFDYVTFRQFGHYAHSNKIPQNLVSDYVSLRLPACLKQKEYELGTINKVFASSWLSDKQVVFGTKCNKMVVLDTSTRDMVSLPILRSSEMSIPADCPCGIHGLSVNPSKTLLATGGVNTNDVGVYRLPTFDPVCVGERGHSDWIFDMKWVDDEYLVTGSRDCRMALWRVEDKGSEEGTGSVPDYQIITPKDTQRCEKSDKVRALAYNSCTKQIAAISLNAFFHLWDPCTFKQIGCRRLSQRRENVCIAVNERRNIYAVGSQSHVTLVDPRSKQIVREIISRQGNVGIRSVSFHSDVVTIGTGHGTIYFYDTKADSYVKLDCGHACSLNMGTGWLAHDDNYHDFFSDPEYPNAVYTHCYDESGTKLFAAGGPLPAGLYGNYAGLWQ